MSAFRVIAVVAAVLSAPASLTAETGRDAFGRDDFTRAADLWRAEAADGSADAKFGLGLIHDLGLGVPRNSSIALRWYLEAAGEGLVDAQFNTAVMLDAGTGVPRDLAAAALWYARAAAGGHHRAQYNLGLMYEAGSGVPRNADLARAWYTRSEIALSAAEARLSRLAPAPDRERIAVAPSPVSGSVATADGKAMAELVWTAMPGPAGAVYRVEAAAPGDAAPLAETATNLSAARLDLPGGAAPLRWRVGLVPPGDEAPLWSAWQDIVLPEPKADPAAPPAAMAATTPGAPEPAMLRTKEDVAILFNAGDVSALSLAAELSTALARNGVSSRIEQADAASEVTMVAYPPGGDAALARAIADFLPGTGNADPARPDGIVSGDKTVMVRLVGGPDVR